MCLSSYLSCLYINLKRNSLPHILAAAALTALVPVVFSLNSLSAQLAAQPLEMYLSLAGTLLLTPIFLPEQNEEIRDAVRVRRMSYLSVCALRLLYLAVIVGILYGIITGALALCESVVTPMHLLGGICSALFLGAIGLLGSAVSGNAVIGYMASLLYFVLNFTLKTRLGVFYLFGLSADTGVSKLWLLGGAAVMTAAAFGYLKFIRKIN
jgi:hypothetical protein